MPMVRDNRKRHGNREAILRPFIFRISEEQTNEDRNFNFIVACNSVWFYSLNYFEWIIKHLLNEGMIYWGRIIFT